jgi:hypothetical protein
MEGVSAEVGSWKRFVCTAILKLTVFLMPKIILTDSGLLAEHYFHFDQLANTTAMMKDIR